MTNYSSKLVMESWLGFPLFCLPYPLSLVISTHLKHDIKVFFLSWFHCYLLLFFSHHFTWGLTWSGFHFHKVFTRWLIDSVMVNKAIDLRPEYSIGLELVLSVHSQYQLSGDVLLWLKTGEELRDMKLTEQFSTTQWMCEVIWVPHDWHIVKKLSSWKELRQKAFHFVVSQILLDSTSAPLVSSQTGGRCDSSEEELHVKNNVVFWPFQKGNSCTSVSCHSLLELKVALNVKTLRCRWSLSSSRLIAVCFKLSHMEAPPTKRRDKPRF